MSDQIIDAAEPRRMLTIAEVLAIVSVSRQTLFRMERDSKFSPCTYISANRRIWFADEIAAWQEAPPNHHHISRRRS
jgi:predicted DNA-binding transcriptional regulator AlpA